MLLPLATLSIVEPVSRFNVVTSLLEKKLYSGKLPEAGKILEIFNNMVR